MKVGIIGAGAVGGYYGALLVRSGVDVHFLLRSDCAHVNANGLFVESKDGDFSLDSVNAYCRPDNMPLCDVVIVALKTTQNHLLSSILPKVTRESGVVVLLQNGLGAESEVAGILPGATIIGGLCFLCSNKVGPGHIRHLDYGSIRFGQYLPGSGSAGLTPRLKRIAEMFAKASVPVYLAEDLGRARWEKLVWNMGFNGLSVILKATTGRIVKDKASRLLAEELMIEVIRGARVCGYLLEENFAELMMRATDRMIDYSPSMKLDFEAGRPLEIQAIYWRPIQAAESRGFDMNRCRVLAYQLEFMERSGEAGTFAFERKIP